MKVFLNMVGCRLNQAEIEQLALALTEAGVEIVSNPEEADEIIINTCCVTAKASADSRKMLRHHKSHFPNAKVIGTGCWVTIGQEKSGELLRTLDEAYNNATKDQILADILERAGSDRLDLAGDRPDLGARHRTRGFVKVQDGCDNHCAYCLTQVARGRSVSVDSKSVIAYAMKLHQLGVKEIILTGVQLGSWGKDLLPRQTLADLVKKLLDQTRIDRIRLSSIEPWDINPDLINLFKDSRVCPHLHIPLQSGSDEILRKMKRPMLTARFREILDFIRKEKPGLAITTDIICGFPGETPDLFDQSLEFIRKCHFSGGHVFPFSALEGTAAFTMEGQVLHAIRKERTRLVRQILDHAETDFVSQRLGQDARVLFESRVKLQGDWVWQGWSEDFLKVYASSYEDLHNQVRCVRLERLTPNGSIIGRLCKQNGENLKA